MISCKPPYPSEVALKEHYFPVPLIVAYGMGVDSTAVLVEFAISPPRYGRARHAAC